MDYSKNGPVIKQDPVTVFTMQPIIIENKDDEQAAIMRDMLRAQRDNLRGIREELAELDAMLRPYIQKNDA